MSRKQRSRLIRLALLLATLNATPSAASSFLGTSLSDMRPSASYAECSARTHDPAFCARIYRMRAETACRAPVAARRRAQGDRYAAINAARLCRGEAPIGMHAPLRPYTGPDAGSDGLDEGLAQIDRMETNRLLGRILDYLD